MIKTVAQSNSGVRSTSNSQEALRLKKSTSGSITSKGVIGLASKIKTPVISPGNSMVYSIKGSRLNSSKSGKKSNSQTNHNNKSFKILTETNNQTNMEKKVVPKKVEPSSNTGTTVPIKNIKQKVFGKGLDNRVKITGKENEFKRGEKCLGSREKTQQSLLNFSIILARQQELSLSLFEIGRKLGKGRFGDVYMARDLRSGFILGIKMISKKQVKASGMELQLIQEIKIQMFCDHPNILKMYGFFHDSNKIYLLLELATHGCLFKQIRMNNYFEESVASFYFRQVLSGVRYLHSNFIIHRDIKPENILNCFSVLKICDFGWAAYSPFYQRQTFCGTLDYVPPEIVTGEFYDEKADVWCLGVLCYELATGRAPFESKTDENQTYDKILKVDIEFPIYLSPQIVDFIGKILNRDPAKRLALEQTECHDWMRKHQNEVGRMISKQIWDYWIKFLQSQ